MRDCTFHLCLQGAASACPKARVRWLVCLCWAPGPDATQFAPRRLPVYTSICAPRLRVLPFSSSPDPTLFSKRARTKMARGRALPAREQKGSRSEQRTFSSLLVYSGKEKKPIADLFSVRCIAENSIQYCPWQQVHSLKTGLGRAPREVTYRLYTTVWWSYQGESSPAVFKSTLISRSLGNLSLSVKFLKIWHAFL